MLFIVAVESCVVLGSSENDYKPSFQGIRAKEVARTRIDGRVELSSSLETVGGSRGFPGCRSSQRPIAR